MSLPSWWGTSLPCGCVRGVKLCSQADQLWDAVADAHNEVAQAARLSGVNSSGASVAVRLYEKQLAAFSAHVEIEAETAVQATML